jgi:hypothetical protein
MATIQIFSKDSQDLLISFKTEEDWQPEGLEDVETLTDIIREAGSVEIARAIIQFMKKYGTDIPTPGGLGFEGLYCLSNRSHPPCEGANRGGVGAPEIGAGE